MTAKAAELQREVRENAEDYQNYLKDLYGWEKEIKVKDEMLKNAPKNLAGEQEFPIRNKKTIPMVDEKSIISSSVSTSAVELTEHQSKQKALLEKNQGNEYFKEGKYDQAIKHYSTAMELDPTDAILPANRAIALIKVNKFLEAEEDCNKSLNLDPTFIKAYHRRGTARANTGNIELALSDFKKVLSIEPHNKAAQQELDRLSKPSSDKNSIQSTVKVGEKDTTRKKGVRFEQSVTEIKTKSSESDSLKKTPEIVDLSLNHPSLTAIEELLLSVPKNVKSDPVVPIPIISVNDVKQEKLGIEKLVNRFSEQNNCDVERHKIATPAKVVQHSTPPPPKNYIQFDQDFKRLGSNSDLQFQYLKQILPSKLPEIFRESLETDVLGGIINILRTEFIGRKEPVLPWLIGLSRVKRISAVTLFLSTDRKSDIEFLFTHIKTSEEGTEEERIFVSQKLS